MGVHNASLDYVVRALARVDPTPLACKPGDPHSMETGSIDGDLTARMPHNHPLYKVDNGLTFDMIKVAVQDHNIDATITPFRRKWDGRGAILAVQFQHAGKAIYDQLVKDAENILKNRMWSDMTSVILIHHIRLHWKSYITLTDCYDIIPA